MKIDASYNMAIVDASFCQILIRSMVNSTNRPVAKMKKHNFSISAFLIYAEANFFSSSSPERKWIIEKGARKNSKHRN